MKLGIIFPQTEIGADPMAIRDLAQAAEAAGYDHLLAYEHVLGVDPERYPEYRGRYSYRDAFYEPFVLFGHLAAVTQRLEFVFGVLVLPMRQTALVAKQTATLDVLSGGRVRLGVGVGWNRVEHEVMREDFHTRGRRIEEQLAVLRALWADERVDFEGKWHRIHGAGINPLPVRRSIPIWMGGHSDAALRRSARLADGWMPTFGRQVPDEEKRAVIETVRRYVAEAGRNPRAFGLEGRVYAADRRAEALRQAQQWEDWDATHLTLNTMGAGFTKPDQHIEAIQAFMRGWQAGY